MNGASPVLDSSTSNPAMRNTASIGMSHHFLLVLRNNQRSLKKPLLPCAAAAFSNALDSFFFMGGGLGSKLFQVLFRRRFGLAVDPESGWVFFAAQLKNIPPAPSPEQSDGRHHGVKQNGQHDLAHHPADGKGHNGCRHEEPADGVWFYQTGDSHQRNNRQHAANGNMPPSPDLVRGQKEEKHQPRGGELSQHSAGRFGLDGEHGVSPVEMRRGARPSQPPKARAQGLVWWRRNSPARSCPFPWRGNSARRRRACRRWVHRAR